MCALDDFRTRPVFWGGLAGALFWGGWVWWAGTMSTVSGAGGGVGVDVFILWVALFGQVRLI